ncbi:zinc finger protein 345 [Chanos chanos]|uniref:Zinc finger protein 345 n=1 Tax=Chanos chanos TaxID=29144 RepID=A0A6J2WA64_CHACN|nr:zinc finger protein 345-like [Chanos chanos]
MSYSLVDFTCSQESAGGGDAFICTECGEGFGHYTKLVNHMAMHGSLDSFPFNGSTNGNSSDVPIELALHENGTLTVVDKSALSNFSFLFGKPSPNVPWWHESSSYRECFSPVKTAEKDRTLYKCEQCGQAFKSKLSLQQHQQYRSLEQGFKCTLCCKVFNDRQGLREHLQSHAHERFYSCGHCGKRFLKQETLHTHQKEWHGSFGSKSKLEYHQENSIDKSYPCKKCGLRFFWLSDLQSHLISHSHITQLSAETTPRSQKHEKINVRERKNAICSQGSYSERSYRCGICGDRFHQLTDLKKHHLTHESEEGKNDDDDGDSDDDVDDDEEEELPRSQRVRRSSVYGNARPISPKGQMQRIDPSRPIRGRPPRSRHNYGKKVYPCKHCHRVFVHSSSLSRHMRYHKGTLHTCVYCGRRFPQRCDVRRHVIMYHGSELAEPQPTIENEVAESRNAGKETDEKSIEVEEENHEGEEEQSSDNKEVSSLKSRGTYKCRDCFRVFGLLSVYQRHVRYHKREPARQLHRCPHCPCRFSFRSALERHLENHEKEASGEIVKKRSPAVNASIDDNLEHEEEETEDEDNESGVETKENGSSAVLYECTECTQTFSCLQTFLQHQSAHG